MYSSKLFGGIVMYTMSCHEFPINPLAVTGTLKCPRKMPCFKKLNFLN